MNACSICDKNFSTAYHVNRHKVRAHKLGGKCGSIKCPYCETTVRKQKELCIHISNTHGVTCEKDEISFESLEAFDTWKTEIEKKTKSRYVKVTGTRKLIGTVKTLFACHRQGTYVDKVGELRRRQMKRQGTNKTGFGCTSFLELYNDVGRLNVVYWKTHCGHTRNFKRLCLTRDDRAFIAGLIQSGMSLQDIVGQIRANAGSENLERLHMITKKDVHNIYKEFGLSKRTMLEPAIADSLDLGVASVITLGESNVAAEESSEMCDLLPSVEKDKSTLFCGRVMDSIQQKLQLLTQYATTSRINVDCAELVEHYLDKILELFGLFQPNDKSVDDTLQNLVTCRSISVDELLNIHTTFDHTY